MTTGSTTFRSAFVLALTCVVGSAHAQQATAFPWESSVPWPSALGSPGSIGRVVAGDVDGDVRPDVFAVGGAAAPGSDGSREILFYYGPWLSLGVQKLTSRANDIDFQPGPASNPAGKLALVRTSGLVLLSWDETVDPPFAETVVATGAPWADARVVRHAHLDSNATPDYAGVAADGHTLILRRGTTNYLVDAGATIVDVQALQWIQGGAQEVAVLTNQTLRVYDGTGLLLDTFTPAAAAVGSIAVVRFGVDGPDRVAWIAPTAAGVTDDLLLVRQAAPQTEGPIAPPWDDVIGMAAADMDLDGDEDLVLTHAADRAAQVYSNGSMQSTARVFSTNRSQQVTIPHADPNLVLPNASKPVFLDLGNDRRADLLLAVEKAASTSFEILRSVVAQASTSEEVFFDSAVAPFEFVQGPGLTAHFSFWMRTLDYSANATHVQVLVWNQIDAQSPLSTFADQPAQLYAVSTTQQTVLDREWRVYDVPATMPDDPSAACVMPVRWIEVRLVRIVDGQFVQAWPTYTCAVITRQLDYCAIDDGSTTNVEMTLVPGTYCNVPGTCDMPEGSWPAEAITRRRKPDPPPGVIPKVPAPSVNVGAIPAGT